MKSILEFNMDLPEDRELHAVTLAGIDLQQVIHSFDQWLRWYTKHGDPEEVDASMAREKLRELMEEYDVSRFF